MARSAARLAPLLVIGGVAAAYALHGTGVVGTTTARGFSEAIPLDVASTTAGRIAELSVSVGQAVKAGDMIARLDPQLLNAQRQQNLAERGLLASKLLAETSKEEDEVMRAEVWRLRTVAGSQEDRAALAALDKEVGRLDGLLTDQLVKASDVEPRRRERDALAARVGIFDQAQKSGQAGLDARKTRARMDRQALVQLRVAPLREALQVNQATLAQIDLQIAALTLRAPADGVVAAINRRPGEMLRAGEAAVSIVAHRPGIFEVYLTAKDPRVPAVGKAVVISRIGVFTHNVPARVIEVAPTVAEMPLRLRSSPNVPVWGRKILVDASETAETRDVPAGEEIRARL